MHRLRPLQHLQHLQHLGLRQLQRQLSQRPERRQAWHLVAFFFGRLRKIGEVINIIHPYSPLNTSHFAVNYFIDSIDSAYSRISRSNKFNDLPLQVLWGLAQCCQRSQILLKTPTL
jgi:hypothetical protein